jgi:hypothetical protein
MLGKRVASFRRVENAEKAVEEHNTERDVQGQRFDAADGQGCEIGSEDGPGAMIQDSSETANAPRHQRSRFTSNAIEKLNAGASGNAVRGQYAYARLQRKPVPRESAGPLVEPESGAEIHTKSLVNDKRNWF